MDDWSMDYHEVSVHRMLRGDASHQSRDDIPSKFSELQNSGELKEVEPRTRQLLRRLRLHCKKGCDVETLRSDFQE